jgi:hypothetical protein
MCFVWASEVGGSPGQAAPMPSPAGLSVTAATALAPGRLARWGKPSPFCLSLSRLQLAVSSLQSPVFFPTWFLSQLSVCLFACGELCISYLDSDIYCQFYRKEVTLLHHEQLGISALPNSAMDIRRLQPRESILWTSDLISSASTTFLLGFPFLLLRRSVSKGVESSRNLKILHQLIPSNSFSVLCCFWSS